MLGRASSSARKVNPRRGDPAQEGRQVRSRSSPAWKRGCPTSASAAMTVDAVRLINKSEHEAAVTLLIDGLHAMRFVEAREKDGKLCAVPRAG